MELDGTKEALEGMLDHAMTNWLLFQGGRYYDAAEVLKKWSKKYIEHCETDESKELDRQFDVLMIRSGR